MGSASLGNEFISATLNAALNSLRLDLCSPARFDDAAGIR